MLAAFFDASVWTALAAASLAAFASILFLRTRNFLYDSLALAVTESGLLLLAAGIASAVAGDRTSGRLWWTWDARITTALAGFLLYASYLMLRRAIEEPTRRASSAAIVSIFAILDVPLIVIVIDWWLSHRNPPASFAAGWTILPAAAFAAAFGWIRFQREQRRRAQDAERRTAQEM